MPFRTVTALLKWSLTATLLLAALLAASFAVHQSGVVHAGMDFAKIDTAALDSGFPQIAQYSAYILTALFAFSVILSPIWIYLAARRARKHAVGDLKIHPVWSVISWFLPGINIFAPFRAFGKIWLASTGRKEPMKVETHPLIGFWWGMCLLLALLGAADIGGYLNAGGDIQAYRPGRLGIAAAIALFFALWSFLGLVLIVSRNLAARERGDEPVVEYWEKPKPRKPAESEA